MNFQASSIATLDKQSKVKVLQAYDREVAIAMELKRREEKENTITAPTINTRHQAYASAYPLHDYVRETFPVIEGGREFKDNWHISIICEVLQSATIGEIRNFIINIPRRTMKSLLICVMWQTWVWTFLTQTRWVYTSYSQNFAKRDNEKCQALINSKYYQDRWGHLVKLVTERRDKIENTAGGFRTVFRIGKGVGEGGDFVIADDPNAIDEVESEAVIQKTNVGYTEVSYHNVTDRNTACRSIIQQRTGWNDLTGYILEDEALRKLYVHLCLPMKYESDHPHKNCKESPLCLGKVSVYDKARNPNLIVGEDKLWIDPRDLDAPFFDNLWYQEWYRINFTEKGLVSKGDGQLLWESYIGAETVAEEISHLKAYGEASQFQQRPTRRGGNFFNSAYFLVNDKPLPLSAIDLNNMKFCRFWDKAGTKDGGDFTVGMLVGMAIPKDKYLGRFVRNLYIIDIIRCQVGLYERMQLIERTAKEDTYNYVETKENTEYCIGIEIEGASSGKDLETLERDALLGYDVILEKPRGTKAHRANSAKSFAEAGRLKLIAQHNATGFISRLEKFDPNKTNNRDDEIDTLSGAIRRLVFGNTARRTSSSGV